MKKTVSKLIAVALVLALALSIASVALAAQTQYATQAVNVRSGPGTNYAVLGYLKGGDSIQATGSIIAGWTEVQYSTYEKGFIKSNYLSTSVPTTAPSGAYTGVYCGGGFTAKVCTDCGTIYQATGRVNVRSGPSTGYAKIGQLIKGQQVTGIGQSGKWIKILTNEGVNAYVSSSYLKAVSSNSTIICPPTGSIGGSSVQLYPEGTRMYATTALNVRTGPGTNYAIMTSIDKGEGVRFLDNIGNWYRISWGGYTGYCSGNYLSLSAPSYSYPSYGCPPCGNNYCGYCGKPTCTGTCWNGCNNPCNDKNYVYAQVGAYYQTRGSTSVYSSPSATSTVRGSIKGGYYVQVIEIQSQSEFCKIRYDNGLGGGLTGYVYTRALY